MVDPALIRHAVPALVRTARLRVRRDAVEDAEAIWRAVVASRAELAPWLDWVTADYDLGEATRAQRRAVEYWNAGDSFQWRLWHDLDSHFVGSIDLHTIDWDTRTAELGYWLATSSVGAGYLVEAGAAVLDIAFELLGFASLALRCHPRNARSLATARRLGFAPSGAEPDGTLCFERLRYPRRG